MKEVEQEVKLTFEDIHECFKHTEYSEIVQGPRVPHTIRYSEGCYSWNGRYWELCNSSKLQAILSEIIIDKGEIKRNRQEAYSKNYLSHFSITDEEFEVDTEFLINTESGVIDLRNVLECWKSLRKPSVAGLMALKKHWLLPHENFKENYLTHMAKISLPENFDNEKFEADMDFLNKTFLVTFGNQEESYDWFLLFLALSLSGENFGNVFCSLLGKQNAGKSTIIDFLTDFFGSYLSTISTDCLFKENFNNMGCLYNNRNLKLLIVSEPNNDPKEVSLLKRVTGHDQLSFDSTQFYCNASILITSNHILVPKEVDTGGFDRRYAIVPCGPVIKNPDANLLNKLVSRKGCFLLMLLERYARFMVEREQHNIVLRKPEISNFTITTIKKFLNPLQWFFDEWCSPFPVGLPYFGDTNIRLTDLRALFQQDFYELYESSFSELFYASEDFHLRLTEITPKQFDDMMKSKHFNYDNNHQGRAIVFHNFICRRPVNGMSVRDYVIEETIKLGFAADKESANELINQYSKRPTVLLKEDCYEENFTDLLGDMCFPSFGFFNISASRGLWMSQMLLWILKTNCLNFFPNYLTNWLYISVKQETAMEICLNLQSQIQSCRNNFQECCKRKEINDIMATLFKIYVDTARKQKMNLILPQHSPVKKFCISANAKKEM